MASSPIFLSTPHRLSGRRAIFWLSVRRRPDMFSFDGFRFGYLIGSASAEGTTKLSKPEVNLLTPRSTAERKVSVR
jgi:hypothetical protein